MLVFLHCLKRKKKKNKEMISLQELKSNLEAEHKRDVRLTIIRNVLLLTVIVAVVLLIYFFAYNSAVSYFKGIADFFNPELNSSANTYMLIVAFVFLSGIAYGIYDIVRLFKRPAKIDEFIRKIEEGKVAANVFEHTVYKIIIPLIKIKLKLSPVVFMTVNFSQEIKSYKLPISPNFVPDAKTFLSGVNANDVRKAWYELYDGETTTTNETSTLNSTEEFKTFVDNELSNEINSVEKKRKKGSKVYIIFLAITIAVSAVFMLGNFFASTKSNYTQMFIIGFVAFSVVYYLILYFTKIRPSRSMALEESFDVQFKTKIFNRIIGYINPKFSYVMHGCISLPEFLEMGFFEEKQYKLSGNDQIIGKHSGVPFQLCDLQVTRKRNFSQENEAPDNVFEGQVFIAKFNKEFNGEVYIVAKNLDGKFSTKGDAGLHLDYLGEKVKLEDPEFMKMFKVYAENQLEARYILSASMMQRIKDLAKTDPKGKFMISFKNNRISVANNSHRNNFEVSMFKSISKDKQIVQFYEELCNQLRIIDDLKLNVNIWKSI